MKLTSAVKAFALATTAIFGTSAAALAACDPGEVVIKFAHVTNADKHPKGIAASLFAERVNTELQGRACVEVFPNSTLYDDDQVLEAMLQGDVQMLRLRSRNSRRSPKSSTSSICRSCSKTWMRLMRSKTPKSARI